VLSLASLVGTAVSELGSRSAHRGLCFRRHPIKLRGIDNAEHVALCRSLGLSIQNVLRRGLISLNELPLPIDRNSSIDRQGGGDSSDETIYFTLVRGK